MKTENPFIDENIFPGYNLCIYEFLNPGANMQLLAGIQLC
jgi:hypothetical protein